MVAAKLTLKPISSIVAVESKKIKTKVSATKPNLELSPNVVKDVKLKSKAVDELENSDSPEFGPPRRAAGRPPRPKRVIVQALLCDKKRKFKEFEPLIAGFISEETLDLHKWIADKRQEILHKFKKFKYMAFYGEDGFETGPKQSPGAQ